ncbi:MAG: EamA family transporter [Candidatus Schekmanbacteria bacterium]|nr:EamA family transporter [Candidatus Schekmanbacteria bacterium]
MDKYGFGLALLTACLWGITPVVEKIGLSKVNPLTAVTIRSLSISIISVCLLVITGQFKELIRVEKSSFLCLAAGGICAGLIGMWTYFKALKYNPGSLVVPIAATYPLIALLMSVIFLGEKFTLIKGLGTLLIVAGIALIKG